MNSERKGPLDGIPAGENWRRLAEFVNGELTDVLAERVRSHPENVRPFSPDYAKIAEVAAGPRT